MNSPRIIRTEYAVMRRTVTETWEGAVTTSQWEYIGCAASKEKCYADVIGPAYPADYDGTTVYPDRLPLIRRDSSNPHLRPYEEGAIFQMLWQAGGGWRLGRLIENF